MNFIKQLHSLEEARNIDMVDYLSKLGHEPTKIRNNDYWYQSPLRNEKIASFKINRKMNRWYDHGIGKGGNIIDFIILYHKCSVGESLSQLSGISFFQQPSKNHLVPKIDFHADSKIKILHEKTISSFALVRYLHQRRLPMDLVDRYCKEVKYELNSKEYFGISFKNDSGGHEIRNPFFKASSSPKDITTFKNGGVLASVFEGFTDFLSFMAIHKNQPQIKSDYVVLNSVSFFEKARPFMEQHKIIKLYLDRDKTGQKYSQYALSLSNKYKDESCLYKQHKDLNDWIVNFGKSQKNNLGYKL